MELLQLKYFCDAAKSENFSKTAKHFGVPPSDISQSIRRLERELGVLLFVRQANKITLNERGVDFYRGASEAIRLLDEAKNAVNDDVNQGRIDICINSNRRIVMKTLEKFKTLYPMVEVRTMHFDDPDGRDFDLVITGESSGYDGFERRKLVSESISLAVRSDSPLAACDRIDVASLSGESFIAMTEKSSLHTLTKKICSDYGFAPRIAVQSDDPFYVRKCVELGLGIAFVPNFSWQGQFPDSVVLKPIEDYIRDTYLYTRSHRYLSLATRKFVEMLLAECAETES